MRCVKLQYMRVSLVRDKASAARTMSGVMVPVVAVAVATMLMGQILAFASVFLFLHGMGRGWLSSERKSELDKATCSASRAWKNAVHTVSLPLSRFAELENRNLALRQTCDPARAKLYGKALKFSVAEKQR
ncbi:hypothetical protein FVE85_8205 [Porphyridium purpureum]|uniref:Uncharacterized protein n=1 Tax=Porphyridium purpureum TaxID=35688 RepID=A0A5J4YN63_PORPP|nr:hypothetical protein FVE85_8205 [Porphyridium purpureum]|eukprot:POR2614..scf295_9